MELARIKIPKAFFQYNKKISKMLRKKKIAIFLKFTNR